MFPLPIIVKNKIYQSPSMRWCAMQCWMDLSVLKNLKKSNIETEFCKNEENIKKFISNIKAARNEILQMDLFLPRISNRQLSSWDLIKDYNMTHFIEKMAKSTENIDFDSRHHQNEILALSTPKPNAK